MHELEAIALEPPGSGAGRPQLLALAHELADPGPQPLDFGLVHPPRVPLEPVDRMWKGARIPRKVRANRPPTPCGRRPPCGKRTACKNRRVAALAETVDELRSDRVHGGSWMARRAVEALLDVAAEPASSTEELLARLLEAGRELAHARPAMGGITHAVARLVASAETASNLAPDDLQRLIAEEANGLIASRDRAAASIAVHLGPMLQDATVLTHSASATVREAVVHTPPARVFCTASAPFEEGRAFAQDLAGEGLDVELVEDDDAERALETASLVLVGADTVYEDGSVKNKIGTRPLAEAAQRVGVRTVVACELLKLVPVACPSTEDEPDLRDTTPPELVEEIVTEEGSTEPEHVKSLLERTPFLRDGYRLLKA
jgi:ribose 1,5-bisphosphate isomerase